VHRRRANARADHEHRIVWVRSYAFGGGGSGAVAMDASIESEYAGIPLAGSGTAARGTTLAIVVTPQLDIDSQHRS
jgi:hypothetical protein